MEGKKLKLFKRIKLIPFYIVLGLYLFGMYLHSFVGMLLFGEIKNLGVDIEVD